MKLNPEIYRSAAELIHRDSYTFCCTAIRIACGNVLSYDSQDARGHRQAFEQRFRPIGLPEDRGVWWPVEDKAVRINALNEMAQLVTQQENSLP